MQAMQLRIVGGIVAAGGLVMAGASAMNLDDLAKRHRLDDRRTIAAGVNSIGGSIGFAGLGAALLTTSMPKLHAGFSIAAAAVALLGFGVAIAAPTIEGATRSKG